MVFSFGLTRKSMRERPEQSKAWKAVFAVSEILVAVWDLMGAGMRRLALAMPADLALPDWYLSEKVKTSCEGTGCSQTEVLSVEPELPRTEMLISLKPSADSSTNILRS